MCKCAASTFIDDETITRGTGRIYEDGTFEHPCPHGNDMAFRWDERTKDLVRVGEKGGERG